MGARSGGGGGFGRSAGGGYTYSSPNGTTYTFTNKSTTKAFKNAMNSYLKGNPGAVDKAAQIAFKFGIGGKGTVSGGGAKGKYYKT